MESIVTILSPLLEFQSTPPMTPIELYGIIIYHFDKKGFYQIRQRADAADKRSLRKDKREQKMIYGDMRGGI
jgi:hypothetical protein